MSVAAAAPPTGPSGSAKSTSRSKSTTSWKLEASGRRLLSSERFPFTGGTNGSEAGFYRRFTDILNQTLSCGVLQEEATALLAVPANRVRRTMIRRSIHKL